MSTNVTELSEKMQGLSPQQIAEIDDFVEFLKQRDQDHALTRAAMETSAPAFAQIWSNPVDDVYDAL
jgi:hypothetical protein